MLENTERPTLEENYISTASSSNLRVESDKGSDAEILIASGWSRAHVGGALMRLHTEYSRAKENATDADYRLMMLQLKTLPTVLDAITHRARWYEIERPSRVAMAVIARWLDPVCPVCTGQKYEKIKDSPATSAKPCKACHAVGEIPLLYGSDGRRIEEYMLSCLNAWRSRTARRLNGKL